MNLFIQIIKKNEMIYDIKYLKTRQEIFMKKNVQHFI